MSKRGLGADEAEGAAVDDGGADAIGSQQDKRARTMPSTALVAVDTSTALIAAATVPVRAPSGRNVAGIFSRPARAALHLPCFCFVQWASVHSAVSICMHCVLLLHRSCRQF